MSHFETFKYVLPELRPVVGYTTEGLKEQITAESLKTASAQSRLDAVAVSHPWLNQCIVTDDISYMRTQQIVVQTTANPGEPFVVTPWHVDRYRHGQPSGQRMRLLATSTPTSFAEGQIVVDRAKLGEYGIWENPALSNNVRKLGADWLAQAQGIVPSLPNQELGNNRVVDLIVDASYFKVVQAKPGELAEGLADEMLHTASVLQPHEPLDRALFRALYVPVRSDQI